MSKVKVLLDSFFFLYRKHINMQTKCSLGLHFKILGVFKMHHTNLTYLYDLKA